jgi:hypothetical protein
MKERRLERDSHEAMKTFASPSYLWLERTTWKQQPMVRPVVGATPILEAGGAMANDPTKKEVADLGGNASA